MKILNLYAGIGGNRKLWGDEHEITAVEYDKNIAAIYKDFYPNDNVIVADAHEYLLNHYKEFDFIWSSPPCPTHSMMQITSVLSDSKRQGNYNRTAVYPDMSLYQEIILLKHFHPKRQKFVIENVKPYYEPLIKAVELQRHLFWCNFEIKSFQKRSKEIINKIHDCSTVYDISLKNYSGIDKRKCLRNMVNPELALHILNCAIDQNYEEPTEQGNLFAI